jgi:hypothetical protein
MLALATACLVLLILQALAQPFSDALGNRLETFSLFALTVLAILQANDVNDPHEDDVSVAASGRRAFRSVPYIISVWLALATAVLAGAVLLRLVRTCREAKRRGGGGISGGGSDAGGWDDEANADGDAASPRRAESKRRGADALASFEAFKPAASAKQQRQLRDMELSQPLVGSFSASAS